MQRFCTIAKNLMELVGSTPLLDLTDGRESSLYAKLEYFNPGGSVKDRAALAMIEAAERANLISRGGTIIEPTSGNTGIALAWIGASKGYRVILTMPETMSIERRKLIAAYGAEIVLTPGADGMKGAVAEADRLHAIIPNSFIPNQFSNPANPEIHFITTAEEIWNDTDGMVDVFVAGVGTGGTISGVAKGLKMKNNQIHIVAVEPASSPLLSEGKAGPHKIQGIGANFIPDNFDKNFVDEIFPVTDLEAMAASRWLAHSKGLVVGISSGAAFHAANCIAESSKFRGKTIVVLLPDTGERYLSTPLFDEKE